MATIDEAVAEDLRGAAMLTRVLRPLTWLGLMESRRQRHTFGWGQDEEFRTSALFDRFLSFQVEMIGVKDIATESGHL